jgi:hypothetical protein
MTSPAQEAAYRKQLARLAACKHMNAQSYAPFAYALILCGAFRTRQDCPAHVAVTILDQSAPIVWC